MARWATLKASDSDRERIVERLRQATAEGRLLAEELEERLGRALSARTYGELQDLVVDLPSEHRRRSLPRTAIAVAVTLALVIVALAVVVLVVTGLGIVFLWGAVGWWMLTRGRCGARRRRNRRGALYGRSAL